MPHHVQLPFNLIFAHSVSQRAALRHNFIGGHYLPTRWPSLQLIGLLPEDKQKALLEYTLHDRQPVEQHELHGLLIGKVWEVVLAKTQDWTWRELEACAHCFLDDPGIAFPYRTFFNKVEERLQAGRRIYLHCWGGIGRTGTTVGCYLVRQGKTGEQALEQLSAWWRGVPKSQFHPRSPETQEQVNFIHTWAKQDERLREHRK